jgi:hypothetical protein
MRDVKDEGNGGFYDDLFTKSSLFPEKLHPKEYASHEISISARADNGSCMIFKSSAVSPFCKTATARGVTSSLVLKSALNPLFHSSLRFSSDSVLHLQSQLNITPNTRVTFEAQESASDKAPTSFAKIGGDYRGKKMFADVKVDAVNGPTVEGCYGVLYGV